jgi:hypothetical protein
MAQAFELAKHQLTHALFGRSARQRMFLDRFSSYWMITVREDGEPGELEFSDYIDNRQ